MTILAALSLAATLALGGSVGCGSSSSGGPTTDGGGGDSSSFDSAVDGQVDSGPETGTPADTGAAETAPETAAAEPTFTPAPGPFTTAQSVKIASATPNATIFYTTNGTQPGPSQPSSLLYTSPIAVSTTTTILAVASATGFLDSTVAVGTYTINIAPGSAAPPAPNPLAGTLNNDFHLGLTSTTPGVTICFTLDGSTPTCAAGVCQGTSQTYNAQTQVPITGTFTDPATGKVTVNAISCLTGDTNGVMPAQTYTLQVAQPSIEGPSPGVLTYNAATPGIAPTVGSLTNGATGLETTNAGIGASVSCTNGTPIGGILPAPFPLSETAGAQTFWVVGCKPGYAQSTVTTAAYTVDLNEPTFTFLGGEPVYDAPVAVSVNDHINAGAIGEYVCVTTDGTAATCAAAGACGGTGISAPGGATTPVSFPLSAGPLTAEGKVNVNGAILQAVACTNTTHIFVDSGSFSSGAYTLKLDPVHFVPAGGTPIPASGTLVVTVSQNGTGLPYDFICSSQDGTTVPDCTCSTAAHPTLTKSPGATAPLNVTASTATIAAVGCLNPPAVPDTNVFLPSDAPPATASYQPATVMATPTITPGGTINDPVRVQFVNNEAVGHASAYFCYTTNGTAPTYATTAPNICHPAGYAPLGSATVCTASSVAPGASSLLTEAPSVTTTGTTINAIACDVAGTLQGSATAAPIDYTLVVGNPLITPKTPVVLGSALTIATTTWPFTGKGVSIHYSEDGTTPNCSGAYAALTVNCAGGPCLCGGVACSDPTVQPDNGPFTATYYALAGEGNIAPPGTAVGGSLKVIACATGYTSSASTDSTTLTPFAGATPTFTPPSGKYDDYIKVTLSESPGTLGGWFCVGNGAGCGGTNGTCTGVAVTPQAATANYSLASLTAGTVHSGGQPAAAPSFVSVATSAVALPSTTLGNTPTAVACQPPAPAQATILPSATGSATYTFQTSAVSLSSPTPSVNLVGSTTLTFNEATTTSAPDGTPTAVPVLGATNGANTYVCATTAALPAQPSSCGDLVTLFGAPACAIDTGVQAVGAGGPTLTFSDVGANVTYNIVSCKDLMTWSTSTATVSFAPYSRTIAMTGSATDFNASETIPSADAGNAYISWDLQNLYLGLTYAGLAATDTVQAYIGSSNGTGATTADNLKVLYAGATAPTFPAGFNALYHVWWNVDNTDQGINQFAGTWKVTTTNNFEVKFNLSSTFVEFAIPLTSLVGVGNDLHLLGGDWSGTVNKAEWPSANNDGLNWLGWQAEFLNDAFAPNDINNLEKN